MRDRLQRTYNNISRLISNEYIAYKIYLVWLVMTLVLFGFFGIYPLSKSIFANYKLTREMVKTNSMLTKKIADITDAKEKMDRVSGFLNLLELYLPEEFSTQNYMVDFIFVAADGDYVVDRFTPLAQTPTIVDISVNLIGIGDFLKVINNLEALIRVTEIQNIRFTKNVEYNELTLTVRTFIMEKQ